MIEPAGVRISIVADVMSMSTSFTSVALASPKAVTVSLAADVAGPCTFQ